MNCHIQYQLPLDCLIQTVFSAVFRCYLHSVLVYKSGDMLSKPNVPVDLTWRSVPVLFIKNNALLLPLGPLFYKGFLCGKISRCFFAMPIVELTNWSKDWPLLNPNYHADVSFYLPGLLDQKLNLGLGGHKADALPLSYPHTPNIFMPSLKPKNFQFSGMPIGWKCFIFFNIISTIHHLRYFLWCLLFNFAHSWCHTKHLLSLVWLWWLMVDIISLPSRKQYCNVTFLLNSNIFGVLLPQISVA